MSHAGRIRSSLPQPSSMNTERIKREIFEEEGILVVSLNDPRLPWQDRELLRQIGLKLFLPNRPKLATVGSNGRTR